MIKTETIKNKQINHIENEIKIIIMIEHPFMITFVNFI